MTIKTEDDVGFDVDDDRDDEKVNDINKHLLILPWYAPDGTDRG